MPKIYRRPQDIQKESDRPIVPEAGVEKSSKVIGQVYGYFICLTAIILFLTSAQSIVGAIVDLRNPKFGADLPGSNLESFEKYKMNVLNSLHAGKSGNPEKDKAGAGGERQGPPEPAVPGAAASGTDAPAYIPDDSGLRTMYEAEKEVRLDSARHVERRRIVENGLMGLLSAALFVVHWLWLRKRPRAAAKAA